MNLDARLPGADAARAVGVSRQLLNSWRAAGHLERGMDGRYRLGDVLEAERATRTSGYSHRHVAA